MTVELNIHRLNERYIVLKCNASPSTHLLKYMLQLKVQLEQITGRSLQHTYTEIGIDQCDEVLERKVVSVLYSFQYNESKMESKLYHLPVCYDVFIAQDIAQFAVHKKLTVNQVIALHTAPVYTVYFNGFLPGFPYLLGLDTQLHLPRKATPELKIPKGAVAIGGDQTGIYPQESPAGWWNIGNCPVPLFGKNDSCISVQAGDHIKFHAIFRAEFDKITNKISFNEYIVKTELYVW